MRKALMILALAVPIATASTSQAHAQGWQVWAGRAALVAGGWGIGRMIDHYRYGPRAYGYYGPPPWANYPRYAYRGPRYYYGY